MSLKDILFSKKEEKKFYYKHDSVSFKMAKALYEWIPKQQKEVIVVCIGTDRSTGDSLGPLVGSLLSDFSLRHLKIYGSLDNPIHAKNLEENLAMIQQNHPKATIIAIDACLGKQNSIGTIITGIGPLKPGAAVQKQLPEVGDIHISAIVNISGYMEYFILQNTRLSLVMQMAKQISQSIRFIDYLMEKQLGTKQIPS